MSCHQCINMIAISLGVFIALEDDGCCTLSGNKAIGYFSIGATLATWCNPRKRRVRTDFALANDSE